MDGLPPELMRMLQQAMAGNPGLAQNNGGGRPINPQDDIQAFFGSKADQLPQPAGFPTPAEVRRESRQRVTKIFQDWNLLNHIVQRHEATIQKRWLKKTREQRKSILLRAWPNMSASHRPDLEALFKEGNAKTKARDAYMWPNINQEDLLKPKLLLIFLNSRARNFPSAFAGADHESFRFATTSSKVPAAFLNEYTMLFTGRDTPETYGELYSWDDNDEAADWLFTKRGMHPGYGLQTLEVQERIYDFLVQCCLLIIHDMTRESLVNDDSPIIPEPPALTIAEGGVVNSLGAIATMTPYRLPARLDLARLQDIVAAKRSAMEDHIWSLREDPSYFADTLLDMKEHRKEILLDTKGRLHSLMKPYPGKRFWDRVAGSVVSEAYLYLDTFDTLHSQIGKVFTLKDKYEGTYSYEDSLPGDLLEAFLELEFSLTQFIKGPIHSTKTNMVASPPLRASFVRLPEEKNSDIIKVVQKPTVQWDTTQKHLMWLFQTLWDDQQLHLVGLSPLLDEMERLVENDPKARNLFSARVANLVADLSFFAECKRQISLYQPWAASFENDAASHPSNGRFYYPVEKRRTKETTEAMQQAEKNLDDFWEKLDKFLLPQMDLLHDGALTRLLTDSRILHRTPDWVEPDLSISPAERQKEEPREDIVMPLSKVYSEQPRPQSSSGPKTKIKTRGVATPRATAAAEGSQAGIGPQEVDIQPTFTVDKRSLKVFSTLFHRPSTSSQPGEIPWNDFLHAMGATGFGMQKLYGSVWHFKPSNLDVERSILFHEPHPISKIPFKIARRFGRRLFRTYGWRGDMFKLKDE
ncbi:hypothetical protein KVV02_005532 [Mortierella alpina]|uniref:Uncharacterized protein n=1 Tax=Mortierella alpina TaxID=64518 RepID=A0A9P8A089_MORAP|nr:hypothetical protein KVV02_005532 [Mortierella alpina]